MGGKLGFEDWKTFSQVSSDIREDLLLAGSFTKVFRYIYFMSVIVPYIICSRDLQEISSEFALNLSRDQNNAPNTTENSTISDALTTIGTISRIVCGRNISSNTFSSGGAATQYDYC